MTENQDLNEKLESLIEYVQANGRICPHIKKWQQLYKMLPINENKEKSNMNPPVSLILGGWVGSNYQDKKQRLEEQIRFADENGVLDRVDRFLRSLPEEEWYK